MNAKKSLGQHFLHCRWVVDTLIGAAELTPKDTVLEIGPGTGILTRALASRTKQVIAVEKDQRLAAAIKKTLDNDGINNVNVVSGDILPLLKSDFNRGSYKVVANIPYYLTSRLLRLLLEQQPHPETIVLTVQKEVAERILAKPPQMNLLALSVQAFGTPKIIKTVPASCFTPTPRVDSAVIKISDISGQFFQENAVDKNHFFTLIRRAFSQKRKLLANSVSVQHSVLDKTEIESLIAGLGLSKNTRPQELSLQNWADLTKSYYRGLASIVSLG
jgi:16S rRNA (adenine1518-N6/adenine1519-N6)-dimethyltransferase